MSYEFACGDVVDGCPTTFHAGSEDALLGQVAEHAASDHGVTTLPPELVSAVQDAIRVVG